MKDPARLESALRALYQSGLMLDLTQARNAVHLFNLAMQAAKEALESEPTQCECAKCGRALKEHSRTTGYRCPETTGEYSQNNWTPKLEPQRKPI